MKKLRTTLLLTLAAGGLADSSVSFGQTIPKQANFEAIYEVEAHVLLRIDAGNNEEIRLYQAHLLFRHSSEPPLFKDISASCVESAFTAAGESGYCVYRDRYGDTFVETIVRPANAKVGQGTFGSGTGKYAGITGQVSWETLKRPATRHGAISFHGKMTGHYRLP